MNDEMAIRALMSTWIDATVAMDSSRVVGLMAEDAVFLRARQPPIRGRAAFIALQDLNVGKFSLEIHQDIVEIVLHGETAHCWTEMAVTITPHDGSPAIRRAGPTLSVLEKRAGTWTLVRDANMLTQV
jgi:uncharacterized protein (TIGR02246 family)